MGSSTSVDIDVVTNVATNIILTNTQDCTTYMNNGVVMKFTGVNSIFEHNVERVTVKVKLDDMMTNMQNASALSTIANKLSSNVQSQGVALTGFADASDTTIDESITNNASTGITMADIQNCMTQLNSHTFMNFSGVNSVFKDNIQDVTINFVKTCIMTNNQTAQSVTDISNSASQYSKHVDVNPFAFITDCIAAVSKNVMQVVGMIFIMVMAFIFAFLYLTIRHGEAVGVSPAAAVMDAAKAMTSMGSFGREETKNVSD